ncbi:hypothetical protein BDA99DRAFT_445478 [Phascolomyces articulosus]|uniref:Uncharacterized protein n=1 Tax=Phascolomyces articulosus TaxID=60185 RepID=A0AAD5JQZ6_9FUNG|nr:hypothetical protein BDA99DRAFT_445478 [Phascolomyces articulosus]
MLRQLNSFFFILVLTVGIPLTLFFTTRNHIEAMYSLLICAILPLLYTIYFLFRHRKIDIFSFLMFLDYIIAGVVSLATGDATVTILRDSAVTAVVSLVFYATMIPIETTWIKIRPLTFILSTEMLIDAKATYHWINPKGMRQEMSVVDWVWSVRKIRIYHYCLTCGWATCLMGDYIVRVVMVTATDISKHDIYLSGSIIVMIELVIMTVLGVIVAVMTRRVTRQWVRDNDYTEKYGWKMEQLRPYHHEEEEVEEEEVLEEVEDVNVV